MYTPTHIVSMMQAIDKRGCAYETWHLVIHLRDLERHEKFINSVILSIASSYVIKL